jgi:hypothetical protein
MRSWQTKSQRSGWNGFRRIVSRGGGIEGGEKEVSFGRISLRIRGFLEKTWPMGPMVTKGREL